MLVSSIKITSRCLGDQDQLRNIQQLHSPIKFTTVASTVIAIVPVVAVAAVLKEQHALASSSLPLLESNKLDIVSSLSAALS
jgi:hypothetical protein